MPMMQQRPMRGRRPMGVGFGGDPSGYARASRPRPQATGMGNDPSGYAQRMAKPGQDRQQAQMQAYARRLGR